MITTVLFDWGDTLMVDLDGQQGPMCDWPQVHPVAGAKALLEKLSQQYRIFIATNAADSSEAEIQQAFHRADLAQHISGYFCKGNIGIGKGNAEFFHRLLSQLSLHPQAVVMIGDNYHKDISPALSAGLHAIWFNPLSKATPHQAPQDLLQVKALSQVPSLLTGLPFTAPL